MKTTKMSLANIQGKLSKAEMKKIMAGSGGEVIAGAGYKCCRDNYHTSSSQCAAGWSCISGAHAVQYNYDL